jgi:hypothetical protein
MPTCLGRPRKHEWPKPIMLHHHFRKKLFNLLGSAGDEEFIQLLWATHALQSEYSDAGRKFLRPETIPDGAATTEATSQHSIHKWEIETLANELMTTRKYVQNKNGRIHTLRWDHFGAAADCTNWLRKLENSEYRIQKRPEDIFVEMGRIAQRQFDWQRGFANVPQFYRNAYVYGQGACAVHFETKHGISFSRFSEIGFMLFVAFTNYPVVVKGKDWDSLGVDWGELETVLGIIASPFKVARRLAIEDRSKIIHTADKPSILRRYPCLRFGESGERVRSPLPELILERVTSGVFYDVVSGEGPVRDDYGRRFEDYCAEYLGQTFPEIGWEREFSYRKKPGIFESPDIISTVNSRISLVLECKATRMSHQAMFGKNPELARGYSDLSKAVFQIWRFFSHVRRGYIDRSIAADAVGVVLTLDNWLILADALRAKVMEEAALLAQEKDGGIVEEDKRPIVFVAAPELERVLSVATYETFKSSLNLCNSPEYRGWRVDDVHKRVTAGKELASRKYPFKSSMGDLLPWWNKFRMAEA